MPSPRWPMRAMVSCSATPRSQQELAIAVAAANRGLHDANFLPTEVGNKRQNVRAHVAMDRGRAYDAFLQVFAAGFELRLDQSHERGLLGGELKRLRQHELE